MTGKEGLALLIAVGVVICVYVIDYFIQKIKKRHGKK